MTASLTADGQTPITGILKFPSGTAAAPAHTFLADTTTGMYYPGASQLGFSAGGVEAYIFDLTKAGVGQDGSIFQYGNGAIPCPVGASVGFLGSTIPAGWFLQYGQAISRTSYPELFTVIGTTYGSGDGSTTFNLPDKRGYLEAGRDDMGGTAANRITTAGSGIDGITLGAVGGAQTVVLLQANLPNVSFTVSGITLSDPGHTHTLTNGTNVAHTGGGFQWGGGGVGVISDVTANSNTTGITVATQGTAASGGSATAVNKMPPTFIENKIIFAGRA